MNNIRILLLLLSILPNAAFKFDFNPKETRIRNIWKRIEQPQFVTKNIPNTISVMMSPKEDGRSSGRKRRTVLAKKPAPSSIADSNKDVKSNQPSSSNGNVSLFEASSTGKEVGVGGSADGFLPADDNGDSVDGDVNLKIRPAESKLPPISGTALAKNAEYIKKNPVERYLLEFLEPTPVGQEPKLVQAAKTVTWVCVLLLVLVEIFVSVKVGGMPFSSSPTPPPPPQPIDIIQ